MERFLQWQKLGIFGVALDLRRAKEGISIDGRSLGDGEGKQENRHFPQEATDSGMNWI